MNELKVFSVEEANQLLPFLSEKIQQLRAKKDEVDQIEAQIDAVELISDPAAFRQSSVVQDLSRAHRAKVSEFYAVVDEIHSHKCFLKDIDLGLVDFYGMINDRVVYLCWQLGEESVEHWHEIGQGYVNRHPLSDAS